MDLWLSKWQINIWLMCSNMNKRLGIRYCTSGSLFKTIFGAFGDIKSRPEKVNPGSVGVK